MFGPCTSSSLGSFRSFADLFNAGETADDDMDLGVCHGNDLVFLFGGILNLTDLVIPEEDLKTREAMTGMRADFAKHGAQSGTIFCRSRCCRSGLQDPRAADMFQT